MMYEYVKKEQFRIPIIEHLLADFRKTCAVYPVLTKYGVQVIDLVGKRA